MFGRILPTHIRYIAGIDEAGRGPLAGPVSVGIVVVPITMGNHIEQSLEGIRDSKALSPQKRSWWRSEAAHLSKKNVIESATALVGSSYIDKEGIVSAIHLGISRVITRLAISPQNTLVLLDGGLKAPHVFRFQETIVRGDSKEPLISLASILAKERRDIYMINLAPRLPEYAFEQHKGYGTSDHIKRIKKYGMSPIHRKDFVHL